MRSEQQPSHSSSRYRVLTKNEAQDLWEALVELRHPCNLGVSFHEQMIPESIYYVTVPVGPGSFPAEKLRHVMEIADVHGCEVHLIGDGLRLLPKVAPNVA